MNDAIPINKLSEQLGLTSRTLRHWESEGLFQSERNLSSGWRIYDETALHRIKLTVQLRNLDLSLKEIRIFFDDMSARRLTAVIERKIASLHGKKAEMTQHENRLKALLHSLQAEDEDWMASLTAGLAGLEEWSMNRTEEQNLKVITLPPMRVVYHISVGVSPEEEAMKPVIRWIASSGLSGTARLFGGNVRPLPTRPGVPYGYGMCASIPEGADVPDHLKEMTLPGGRYAVLESGDDIGSSWRTLMEAVKRSKTYGSDRSRLCLEEHIRNDKPDGGGSEFYLSLLEPVKRK